MEACLNTASGFILAFVVWHFVALAYAIPMPLSTNLQITGIFTIVSVIRSYLWRRIFNKREKPRESLRDIDFDAESAGTCSYCCGELLCVGRCTSPTPGAYERARFNAGL